MAISTDLDGPDRRRDHARPPGEGGSARANRIRRAQRHSRLVRTLRMVLPAAALVIAGYYAVTLLGASRVAKDIARTAIPKILPANLTMSNPRYRGFTKDGGEYVVAARTAKPDPTNTDIIGLQTVSGQLTQKSGSKLTLAADTGAFNSKTETIDLADNVKIESSDGGWAHLKAMRVETRTGIISSTDPVEFGNPQAKVAGSSLKITQKTKELTVAGKVTAIITPPKGADTKVAVAPAASTATAPATGGDASSAAAAPPTAAQDGDKQQSSAVARIFTGGKGPVEITSDRLDIDDVKKTAIFVGNVTAKQGDVTLTTPELRIAYDGAPSGGLTGSVGAGATATASEAPDATPATPAKGTGSGGAKITSIVAANPVAITQAPATRMTATSAAFDAATQRATMSGGVAITRAPDTRITGDTAGFDDPAGLAYIDGNVVLSQGSDRRVTGHHAEFHNVAQTALMTGDVVLTQGQNILRGRRLLVDQKAGRSELTAPPMGGSGPGRVAAHFIRTEAAGKKGQAAAPSEGGGVLGSFRADPGAPVDVLANQLELIEAQNIAIFRGDVEAQQGTFQFRTTELTAVYTGSAGIGRVASGAPDADAAEKAAQPAARLTHLKARGKVIITSQNGQKATGDWADFDVAANTVTLGGTVVLTQGRNVVKGTRLVIDLASGESVINTDNSAAPSVAGERPGTGWRAFEKPSRPSAVFFPQELRGGAEKAKKSVKPAAASSWQSTTSPSGDGN